MSLELYCNLTWKISMYSWHIRIYSRWSTYKLLRVIYYYDFLNNSIFSCKFYANYDSKLWNNLLLPILLWHCSFKVGTNTDFQFWKIRALLKSCIPNSLSTPRRYRPPRELKGTVVTTTVQSFTTEDGLCLENLICRNRKSV